MKVNNLIWWIQKEMNIFVRRQICLDLSQQLCTSSEESKHIKSQQPLKVHVDRGHSLEKFAVLLIFSMVSIIKCRNTDSCDGITSVPAENLLSKIN